MKKIFRFALGTAVVLVLVLSAQAWAGALGEEVAKAMKTIGVSKGDGRLLVLTNAPYVKAHPTSARPYLAEVESVTGCSVGQGNLLFFQRPQKHSLRYLLFDKSTGDAVIVSLKDHQPVSEKVNLGPASVSDPGFQDRIKDLEAAKDMFTLAAMAGMWAKGAPYDFLKSAELHNHICPGLTSGYLMARYILEKYPLQEGEQYTVVACPAWCKEDALQVMLDCTPGKRSMVVKNLSKGQLEQISVKNPAGMVLIWNAKAKTGKGVVLSFDFDRIRALAPKDASKLALVLVAADHLDHPDRFVSGAGEFELNEERYDRILEAGTNPYEIAGLIRK